MSKTESPFACAACGHCPNCRTGIPEPGCDLPHTLEPLAGQRLTQAERELRELVAELQRAERNEQQALTRAQDAEEKLARVIGALSNSGIPIADDNGLSLPQSERVCRLVQDRDGLVCQLSAFAPLAAQIQSTVHAGAGHGDETVAGLVLPLGELRRMWDAIKEQER